MEKVVNEIPYIVIVSLFIILPSIASAGVNVYPYDHIEGIRNMIYLSVVFFVPPLLIWGCLYEYYLYKKDVLVGVPHRALKLGILVFFHFSFLIFSVVSYLLIIVSMISIMDLLQYKGMLVMNVIYLGFLIIITLFLYSARHLPILSSTSVGVHGMDLRRYFIESTKYLYILIFFSILGIQAWAYHGVQHMMPFYNMEYRFYNMEYRMEFLDYNTNLLKLLFFGFIPMMISVYASNRMMRYFFKEKNIVIIN